MSNKILYSTDFSDGSTGGKVLHDSHTPALVVRPMNE